MIVGKQLVLEGNVSEGDAPITEHMWEATRNGNLVQHGDGDSFAFTPGKEGHYVVSLTVTDENKNQGSETISVLVEKVDEYLATRLNEEHPDNTRAAAQIEGKSRNGRENYYNYVRDMPDTDAQMSDREDNTSYLGVRIEDFRRS